MWDEVLNKRYKKLGSRVEVSEIYRNVMIPMVYIKRWLRGKGYVEKWNEKGIFVYRRDYE